MRSMTSKQLDVHPLTPERWNDLEALFGERGACGGCWCMWWLLRRAQFVAGKGQGNRRALRKIVHSGEPPGLIGYMNGQPVGWCAVAPRDRYIRLETSRILKPVDDQPVWSVTCFFVARPYRRQGITSALLRAAVDYAAKHGATIVEGYPVEPGATMPDPFVYTGMASTFRAAGFQEAARRSATRPIMRFHIRRRKDKRANA
jgi:GNAT superfamily N-acetyltransferase